MTFYRTFFSVVVFAFVGLGPSLAADARIATERVGITVTPLADGLDHPWGIAVLPDGRLLVTERSGRLRIVNGEGRVGKAISGVPRVDARDQGGLLDVALHPDFQKNRLVYLSFAEAGPKGTNSTALALGRLSGNEKKLEAVKIIFSQQPKLDSTQHFGSRIVFDKAGHVYLTMGDRSKAELRDQAQSLRGHIGKVVRLNTNGSVPKDNPFVGQKNAKPEIWSYGHRNVQGAALHPRTGEIWTIEHGPMGGDEINVPKAGKNYGWPVISHGVNYDGTPVGSGRSKQKGMEQPIYTWTPVIAPGGAIFHSGKMFPEWRGNLFVSGLRATSLVRLETRGDAIIHEERLLTNFKNRIRDVAEGLRGEIYVITDAANGEILKITRSK